MLFEIINELGSNFCFPKKIYAHRHRKKKKKKKFYARVAHMKVIKRLFWFRGTSQLIKKRYKHASQTKIIMGHKNKYVVQ